MNGPCSHGKDCPAAYCCGRGEDCPFPRSPVVVYVPARDFVNPEVASMLQERYGPHWLAEDALPEP